MDNLNWGKKTKYLREQRNINHFRDHKAETKFGSNSPGGPPKQFGQLQASLDFSGFLAIFHNCGDLSNSVLYYVHSTVPTHEILL